MNENRTLVEVENVSSSRYSWSLTNEEIDREVKKCEGERRPLGIYRGKKETIVVWEERSLD